jgi:phosphinothricin acetyltransferase
MQFRNATIEDLPAIVAIYNSTVEGRLVTADTQPVTVADKVQWFNSHNRVSRPLWMVEAGEQFIGWVSFQDFYGRPAYAGTAEISIYLHEKQRGKGYGKKILQRCITEAGNLGIHTLLGFIFSHNIPSIRLFSLQGFTEWGHLKDVAVMDGRPYSLVILGRKIV